MPRDGLICAPGATVSRQHISTTVSIKRGRRRGSFSSSALCSPQLCRLCCVRPGPPLPAHWPQCAGRSLAPSMPCSCQPCPYQSTAWWTPSPWPACPRNIERAVRVYLLTRWLSIKARPGRHGPQAHRRVAIEMVVCGERAAGQVFGEGRVKDLVALTAPSVL